VVTASSREEQDEPTPTVTPTVFPGVPTTSQTQTGLTVQQYKKLYQDMLNSADKPKHSLVQVIGISGEMDYFNQNYEDRKQVSGFMIAENDRDLFILTEYRAVANVKRIQVVFGDNSMADATVQKADENTGLAVVKVPLDSVLPSTKAAFVIATLGNSYYTTTGDPVLVLGSPMGYSDAVFFGVITSIKNKTSVFDHEYSLLTTDIEGSSTGSGILVNLNGEVIGVITQGLHQEGGSTITGISISEIKTLIQSLSNNETVSYAGIKGQEVTDDISTRTGIPLGLLTTDIAQDSPAMLAGIKEYDVIQEIAGQEIRNMNDLSKMIDSLKGGDVVSVKAMRKGASGYAEVNFSVTLSAK
jgi:serine protease Do